MRLFLIGVCSGFFIPIIWDKIMEGPRESQELFDRMIDTIVRTDEEIQKWAAFINAAHKELKR